MMIGVLHRLAARAYPTAVENTRDLLARDHFITHFAVGDFRVSLRSSKPDVLESSIDLVAEVELLRSLEQTQVSSHDVRVFEVSEHKMKSDDRIDALMGVVEGLCQEVKTLQHSFQTLQVAPTKPGYNSLANLEAVAPPVRARHECGSGCWMCGYD